ncbi:MAG: MFS transporter [Gammaproteobacteria bacterium]|nr:MFS transporter [Gammaproteobacteria bacterium]
MSILQRLLGVPGLAPRVAQSFRREQVTELTLPVATSLMEGGFVAVVAAKAFAVEPWVIAVISASPMFGNLSSFFWNRVSTARPKIPMIVTLQLLVLCCVVAIAASPRSAWGAWVLVASVIGCRLLIAGIITARSVAWSLNYGRGQRARVTGRLQIIASMVVVLTTSLAGLLLDAHPENFRWLYGGGALVGLIGVWSFSHVFVMGEKRHRVLERQGSEDGSTRNQFFAILIADRMYARYQLYQFTSGVAAMMLEPALVYLVTRQMGASYVASIGITMIIPFLLNLTTLPFWARYLDRVHVAEFRARQNAGWVVGVLVMFWGAYTLSLWWLAIGRVVVGIVNGGGSLAWQLGHNDFAPKDQLSAYMGVHVTLTGVRGAFAPFLGMALFVGWTDIAWLPDMPGIGPWLFIVSALLGATAWYGFDRLRREIREKPRQI